MTEEPRGPWYYHKRTFLAVAVAVLLATGAQLITYGAYIQKVDNHTTAIEKLELTLILSTASNKQARTELEARVNAHLDRIYDRVFASQSGGLTRSGASSLGSHDFEDDWDE